MTLGAFFSPFGDSVGSESGFEDSIRLRDTLSFMTSEASRNAPLILWVSRSARLLMPIDFTIPSDVTMAFAPGAVLTVGEGATLDIAGRLDIGPGRHFQRNGGRIVLRGPLDEIDASWWADERSRGTSVVEALDVLWDRYERSLPQAPIVLTGPYWLEETLRVVPPESLVPASGLPFDVVMRGRHYGRSSPTTFGVSASKSVGALDALVAVDGTVVLTLENIGFDLARPEGFPAVRAALLLTGAYDRSRIEACTFRLAGGTGVHVTTLWDVWRQVTGEVPNSFTGLEIAFALPVLEARATRQASRLVIAGCDFEGGDGASVGVRVDLVAPTMLDVSDCLFRGAYHRGISFPSADLMVTNCAFDNTTTATTTEPLPAVDIFLGSRERLPDGFTRLAGANAQFTATHCVSTSPIFLVAQRVFLPGDSGGAVLTNVLHQPRLRASDAEATSIQLMGAYESRSLVLQGCELGGSVRFVSVSAIGVVVELGTRFAIGVVPYVGLANAMVGLEAP